MRALPLVVLAIALALPAPARQPKPAAPVALSPAPTLTADSETRWVPFDLTPGNQIAFRMTINGRGATAVLDTGVNFTLAASAFAGSIGLKATASGQAAAAIGGALPIAWAPVESVDFGGLSRHGGRIGVADLSALATGTTQPVDVVVGADLLATHALDIDFDNRRFRLLASGRMPFRGTSVALSTAPQTGTFQVDATIGSARLRPLLLDTGDGSTLTVSREAWTTTRLPDVGLTSAYAVGLAGPIETDLVVLPQVRLGTAPARNIEVRIEPPRGYSTLTGTAGRIGNGFLQRYRVLLDPKARRMILSPGKDADRMPLKSTSGLLLSYEGKALRVLHVMRGSPAATDGWRAGERICAIDGAKLPDDYRTNRLGQWPAGTPGRTVRLGLCDGGPERALTLAAFY
ncbi:aspartyl protease family protein [uncultured Sphingomonas sp.]|uniref:aspartyl protease family protein n=1 Tax=uncultured Sphingomonas sp. TaxID=158754 RepID=UPI0025E58698|nr:aspartyl protease family protein [uncultured Sphingomonas sp.]